MPSVPSEMYKQDFSVTATQKSHRVTSSKFTSLYHKKKYYEIIIKDYLKKYFYSIEDTFIVHTESKICFMYDIIIFIFSSRIHQCHFVFPMGPKQT